eukprot:Hpha_TRINITY_DN13334_c0_g1::TRINITY_DN13334_c0_g1_i1::g.95577::m.95577
MERTQYLVEVPLWKGWCGTTMAVAVSLVSAAAAAALHLKLWDPEAERTVRVSSDCIVEADNSEQWVAWGGSCVVGFVIVVVTTAVVLRGGKARAARRRSSVPHAVPGRRSSVPGKETLSVPPVTLGALHTPQPLAFPPQSSHPPPCIPSMRATRAEGTHEQGTHEQRTHSPPPSPDSLAPSHPGISAPPEPQGHSPPPVSLHDSQVPPYASEAMTPQQPHVTHSTVPNTATALQPFHSPVPPRRAISPAIQEKAEKAAECRRVSEEAETRARELAASSPVSPQIQHRAILTPTRHHAQPALDLQGLARIPQKEVYFPAGVTHDRGPEVGSGNAGGKLESAGPPQLLFAESPVKRGTLRPPARASGVFEDRKPKSSDIDMYALARSREEAFKQIQDASALPLSEGISKLLCVVTEGAERNEELVQKVLEQRAANRRGDAGFR